MMLALLPWLVVLGLAAWHVSRLRSFRRQMQSALDRLAVLAGHANAAGVAFELLQQAAQFGDWVELASGGDNHAGTFSNRDSCPCRHTYTCKTITFQLNAWPNPNPNPLQRFPWNAPPREKELWPCPEPCVFVCTEVWRGWRVLRNVKTGQIQMNINTFAQYHCKEPSDPDRDKPPKGEELPPPPDDIT